MLKKIEETRQKALNMKERRDMNERAFAEKVNRKNKQQMDLI